MKNLKVNFIGADDGYSEVSGGSKYEKWNFQTMGALECVIMARISLPNRMGAPGTYDLYTVIEVKTKKPYAFFCGKVLEDKLKNIPTYSLIKIVFEGVHPVKKYHQFKVFQNLNFKFDPSQYSLDEMAEVKSDAQATTSAPLTTSQQTRTPISQIEEDLPF